MSNLLYIITLFAHKENKLSTVGTMGESNITIPTIPKKFRDKINQNQSETTTGFQDRGGTFVPQMAPIQFQVNEQMRRQMQHPKQIQNPLNTGPIQFQSPPESANSQMMREMNTMQMQYQLSFSPNEFRSQNDFVNPQMMDQMNSMQRQYQINTNLKQFRSQDDSENSQMMGQMNPMQRQYQINPDTVHLRSHDDYGYSQMRNHIHSMQREYAINPYPMQFRSQDNFENPRMRGLVNPMQRQYELNPGSNQFRSQDNSEYSQLRGQLNHMQRQYQMNYYQGAQQKVPIAQNLSEIIERDLRNQWRDQIEGQNKEENPQMRSQMNQREQSSSVKRGQGNIYKVYLREENINANDRAITTMPPKQALRFYQTVPTTKLTGTRSKRPTEWNDWKPVHVIEDEYYPDSKTPKPKGKKKKKENSRDTPMDGPFIDGYHPNEHRFDFYTAIPT